MRRLIPGRLLVVVVATVSACGFAIQSMATNGGDDPNGGGGGDVPLVDAYIPDAGPCQSLSSKECVGPTLRACSTIGLPPTDTACAWGCSTVEVPHCAQLQPSGGGVVPEDLTGGNDLQGKQIANVTIDTVTGSISNGVRPAGSGVANGIDFHVHNGVGVFRFKSLTMQGVIQGTGTNALALVSLSNIVLDGGILTVQGSCTNGAAGPGGHAGGTAGQAAVGAGAGGAGTGDDQRCTGGGGGGYGSNGGRGGDANNPGAVAGDPLIAVLTGGGGGGGGGGNGGAGGGGGGALHLAANGKIAIIGNGLPLLAPLGITASGCGGQGSADTCGGGGGAGGTLLLEAPTIEIDGSILATNGGGGGAGHGTDGHDGGIDVFRALGGKAMSSQQNGHFVPAGGGGGQGQDQGGDGGSGGSRGAMSGRDGVNQTWDGGGGGAIGRIRFNTYFGNVTLKNNAVLSPSLSDNPTTATRGAAIVR